MYKQCWLFALLALVFGPLVHDARADLAFTLDADTQQALPGDMVIFTGTITNTTGMALGSGDLFLNFSDYDSTAFSDVEQDLGNTAFTLPNDSFIDDVDLFFATVSGNAPQGPYSLDVSLEDVYDDVSAPAAAAVDVVPELSSCAMILAGVGIMLVLHGANWTWNARRRAAGTSSKGE